MSHNEVPVAPQVGRTAEVLAAVCRIADVKAPPGLEPGDFGRMLPHDQAAYTQKLVTLMREIRAQNAALSRRIASLKSPERSGIQ